MASKTNKQKHEPLLPYEIASVRDYLTGSINTSERGMHATATPDQISGVLIYCLLRSLEAT